MQKSLISIVLLFAYFGQTNAAVYQEEVKYYDIEVLIFENLKQNPRNTETWPSSVDFVLPENALFIGSPYPGPIPENYNPRFTFKPIKTSTYQLQDEAKALTEHKDYRILYHRSWRQPGMKRENAVSVIIEKEIPRIEYTNNPELQIEPAQFEFNQIINQRMPKLNVLKGTVKISLSRYLHIQTDLNYTRHIIANNTENTGKIQSDEIDPSFVEIQPQVYQLKQTRKMRSKELHYLDNPRLGLLVYITPVKIASSSP